MSAYIFKPSMTSHPSFVGKLADNLTVLKVIKGTSYGDVNMRVQFSKDSIPTELKALNLVNEPNNLVYRNMRITKLEISAMSFWYNYDYIKVLEHWYESQTKIEEIYLYTNANEDNKIEDEIHPLNIYYILKAKYNGENIYIPCRRNLIKLESNF